MQSPAPDSGQVPPCPLMSIEGMFANVTGVTFRGLTRAPRLDRPDDPRFDRLMVLMRTVIQVLREHGVRMPHTWVSVRRRTATTLDVAIGAGSHILWSNVWPWAGSVATWRRLTAELWHALWRQWASIDAEASR